MPIIDIIGKFVVFYLSFLGSWIDFAKQKWGGSFSLKGCGWLFWIDFPFLVGYDVSLHAARARKRVPHLFRVKMVVEIDYANLTFDTLTTGSAAIILFGVAFLGGAIGSFLNVVIYRLPAGPELDPSAVTLP